MISLSSRYASAIVVLAVLAAVPAALNTSGRRDMDDCADPGVLRATLLIPGSHPEPSEGTLAPGELMRSTGTVQPRLSRQAPPLAFAVRRSFTPSQVAHAPGRLAVRRMETSHREVRHLERGDVRLPVHWLEERTRGMPTFAAYFYVYENRPVEGAYRALLGSALRRLTGGPRPLTVMVVGGSTPKAMSDAAVRQAEDWLFAAWGHYRAVCEPTVGNAEIDAPAPLR